MMFFLSGNIEVAAVYYDLKSIMMFSAFAVVAAAILPNILLLFTLGKKGEKKMSNTKRLIFGIISVVILLAGVVYGLIASNASVFDQVKELFNKPEAVETAPADPYLYEIDTRIARQNEVDAMLLSELSSAQYTIDNPLIVVDHTRYHLLRQ